MADIAPNCNMGHMIVVDESCGCTLTRAKLGALTPDVIESFGMTEIDLAPIVLGHAEASILGIPERGLDMLLMGSLENVKGALQTVPVGTQSLVAPYIMRPQSSIINVNYFSVESGSSTPNAGSNGIPASAWNIVVNNGNSPFASPIPNIEKLFMPGTSVIIQNWNTTGNKVSQSNSFTVLNAVNSTSGGVSKATVTIIPNRTDSAWGDMTNDEKAVYQPTFGLLMPGVNNVDDRESWCFNEPVYKSGHLRVDWIQTIRNTMCHSDEYLATVEAIMSGKVNAYIKKFRAMPIAEQNRYRKLQFQKRWANSTLFGDMINEHQTPDLSGGYLNLPTVEDIDPLNPDCLLGYKANAEGFYTRLKRCNRVIDYEGAAVDIDQILELMYLVKLTRENNGTQIDRLDMITNRYFAELWRITFNKWYMKQYGVSNQRVYYKQERLSYEGFIAFNFEIYDVPKYGFQVAITHDRAFEDLMRVVPDTVGGVAGFQNRFNTAWVVDFSDWKRGIVDTKTAVRRSPDAATDRLYNCVITPNVKEYRLESTTYTNLLDNPERHVIFENFSLECPAIQLRDCPIPNPPVDEGDGGDGGDEGDGGTT